MIVSRACVSNPILVAPPGGSASHDNMLLSEMTVSRCLIACTEKLCPLQMSLERFHALRTPCLRQTNVN